MKGFLTVHLYLGFTAIFVGFAGIIWIDTTMNVWAHILFSGVLVMVYTVILYEMLKSDGVIR